MRHLKHHLFISLILLLGMSSVYASDQTLFSGTLKGDFTSWGSDSLEGNWSIVQREGKHFIQLAEDFEAKKGPDVKIFLSQQTSNTINGDNAAKNSNFISLVSSFEGGSEYEIPASVDLSKIRTLVFHCEAYNKLWGTGQVQ